MASEYSCYCKLSQLIIGLTVQRWQHRHILGINHKGFLLFSYSLSLKLGCLLVWGFSRLLIAGALQCFVLV